MSKLIVDIDSILSFLYIQVDNYGPRTQSFTEKYEKDRGRKRS
jgi:hypothetical protein